MSYSFDENGALSGEGRGIREAKRSRLPQPKFEAVITITDSDWISSVQYDPKLQVLDATLKSGRRYRYRGIFPLTFANLICAQSSGRAFNSLIKPLPFTRLKSIVS